jgi:hypothetical protein
LALLEQEQDRGGGGALAGRGGGAPRLAVPAALRVRRQREGADQGPGVAQAGFLAVTMRQR